MYFTSTDMDRLISFCKKAIEFADRLGCKYCDIRAEKSIKNSINIEDGAVEYSKTHTDSGIGIRVLTDGVWGFYSVSDPNDLQVIFDGVAKAVKISKNTKCKRPTELTEVEVYTKTINYPVELEPQEQDIINIGLECDKAIRAKEYIIKSNIDLMYQKTSKFFVNSEGIEILQNYSDTIAEMRATAHGNSTSQSVSRTEGGRGGIEMLTKNEKVTKSAEDIASAASQLINAKRAKEEKATVVMNPDFVSLLTHEILGHPSEGDRVLGKEMAWAGGSWWAGKLGDSIGSEVLNVFDDPTIEGTLGHYYFDDEGVKSTKSILIEKGVLKNHLQSRETAKRFNAKPTANMRATSYKFMPLIRMACTCIGAGDWDPEEMIKETKNGYYIVDMKVPSIDFERYNWNISCQYAQKIENGTLTDLIRDVIVGGTAPEFFRSIKACGRDFTIRPITNCGKGDPMQSLMMGNGGPTVMGEATVKSG